MLIGNPDPDDPTFGGDSFGDIPMKMCWPNILDISDQESPTDYFYADLTGDWNLDGDGYFGEYPDDRGVGGVDLMNEVYVGRIPVYAGVTDLDSILEKIIDYGSATNIGWRENALLPMSFSDSSTDGAHLSEAMITNYLLPQGFSYWRMYMQGNVCPSTDSGFTNEEELVYGASVPRWISDDFGMVWWWGHGSSTTAALGYTGCGWGTIISSGDATSLDNSHPSFVYQCSCNNGYPENSNNLGVSLLRNGAISTVCASRASWYAVTLWNTWLKYYCDNASIGYYFGKELVENGKKVSVALYDVKSDMGANQFSTWGGAHWMNLFDFNLYGEPSMAIQETGSVVEKDDTLETWSGQGVYYRNSDTGSWVKMAPPATQITAGDITNDGIDDLIGIWPGQGGVWVKYSSSMSWEKLSSTADWIACGKMRNVGGSLAGIGLQAPVGGRVKGPSYFEKYKDFSRSSQGGWNFIYQKGENLFPQEQDIAKMNRIPGPGEPGFKCVKQKNMLPHEERKGKK